MITQRQMSQRKAVRSALERIETLEQDLARIANGLNQVFGQIEERLTKFGDTVDAVIAIVGENEVSTVREDLRVKRLNEQVRVAQEALDKALTEGAVVKVDTVTESSLIVGQEKNKDGEVVPPGRIQLTYATLKPEFKEQLLGKSAGASISTAPNGGTFEVTEVYDIVETPPTPAAAATSEAVSETPSLPQTSPETTDPASFTGEIATDTTDSAPVTA